jgi:hypothetical protein
VPAIVWVPVGIARTEPVILKEELVTLTEPVILGIDMTVTGKEPVVVICRGWGEIATVPVIVCTAGKLVTAVCTVPVITDVTVPVTVWIPGKLDTETVAG